jgi:hypothetical protein
MPYRDEDETKSAFNMGLALLERINTLLNLASVEAKLGRYNKWWDTSLAIYREIYPFLDKEEIKRFKVISQHIPKLLAHAKSEEEGYVTGLLLSRLHSADIYLKVCLKKHDMLLPVKSDPGRAIIR